MKCKVIIAIHRGREGGRYEPGSTIELDDEAYERHRASGNVVSLEEDAAIREGEALLAKAKAEAQALIDKAHDAAVKRGADARKSKAA